MKKFSEIRVGTYLLRLLVGTKDKYNVLCLMSLSPKCLSLNTLDIYVLI